MRYVYAFSNTTKYNVSAESPTRHPKLYPGVHHLTFFLHFNEKFNSPSVQLALF